jgi:Tfp pilus assembly protein PilN
MQTPGTQGASRSTPPSVSVPMRVSFNGDLLEVSAVLSDAAAVDRLVKALEANKALLPPTAKKEEAAN